MVQSMMSDPQTQKLAKDASIEMTPKKIQKCFGLLIMT